MACVFRYFVTYGHFTIICWAAYVVSSFHFCDYVIVDNFVPYLYICVIGKIVGSKLFADKLNCETILVYLKWAFFILGKFQEQ